MADNDYNCNHCGRLTNAIDDDGETTLRIRGWDNHCDEDCEYSVCGCCVQDVKGMLNLRKPLPFCCMAEHKVSKKRHAFWSFGELEEWMADNDEKQGEYAFFVRKSVSWDSMLMAAWIGEGLCGGMTNEEARHAIRIASTGSGKDNIITVGWRHHEVPRPRPSSRASGKPTSAMTCEALKLKVSNVDVAYQSIQDYARKNHLENTPFLIEESVMNLEEENILELFCFPGRDKNIVCAADLTQVKSILHDGGNVITTKKSGMSSMDVTFLPGQLFIDYHRAKIEEKINRAKRKLKDLAEVEETIKQREQRKKRKCDKASSAKKERDSDSDVNDDDDDSSFSDE